MASMIELSRPQRTASGEWSVAAVVHLAAGDIKLVAVAPEALAAQALARAQAYLTQRASEMSRSRVSGSAGFDTVWSNVRAGLGAELSSAPFSAAVRKLSSFVPHARLAAAASDDPAAVDMAARKVASADGGASFVAAARGKATILHMRGETAAAKRAEKAAALTITAARAAQHARELGAKPTDGLSALKGLLSARRVVEAVDAGNPGARRKVAELAAAASEGDRRGLKGLALLHTANQYMRPRPRPTSPDVESRLGMLEHAYAQLLSDLGEAFGSILADQAWIEMVTAVGALAPPSTTSEAALVALLELLRLRRRGHRPQAGTSTASTFVR